MQIQIRHTLQVYDPMETSLREEEAFVLSVREAQAVMGETVAAYLERVEWQFDLPTVCRINGELYSRAEWLERALAVNDNVEFVSRPLGSGSGGSTAKTIASVVALVALTAVAGPAGTATAAALQVPALASVFSAAIVGAGALAISHFLKPKSGGKTNSTDALYTFGFQGNTARPMQPIPVLHGRLKFAPDYAAPTYSDALGDTLTDFGDPMTALHVYVRQNAVHVLTDGLQRGPDGQILGHAQKVRILGHLPAVVSGRGPSELPEYFADRATWQFASFDQAVDGMMETWRIAVSQYEASHPGARSRPNMVILAGWSEARGRPESWVVDSNNEDAGALQVMNSCAPTSPDLMRQLSSMGLSAGMASFDPLKDGLRIMRAQRALRFPHPITGQPGQIVGGFCQISSVGAGGVGTRILERWPEDIAA